MKYLIILVSFVAGNVVAFAQSSQYKPDPKAKLLEDSAITKYTKAAGDPSVNKPVAALLETAVKTDSNYYEGWINLMTFQCRIDRYEDALKTVKKMKRIFRDETDVYFFCGILEYKTKRNKDALATFGKLLKLYDAVPVVNNKTANYKSVLINKGITLILMDRPAEGKDLLKKLYDTEEDGYVKSYIAFYINNTKEQIIADKIPGK